MRMTTTTHCDNTLVDLAELVVKRTIQIATVERRKHAAVSAVVDLLFQRDACIVLLSGHKKDPHLGNYLVIWGGQCEFFDTCIRNWCLILIGRELH